MSEILCRVDPEELLRLLRNRWTGGEVRDYLTAHAVPESQAPLLFGGVDEVAECIRSSYKVAGSGSGDVARALLDRFGIPWDKAEEWVAGVRIYWYDPDNQNELFMTIPRPAPSLEDQRKKAIEAIQAGGPELIRKVMEVVAGEIRNMISMLEAVL